MERKMKMQCPICSKEFKAQEEVIMDIYYTVRHKKCFSYFIPAKEQGTYKEIINNNDVFHELLPIE